jgi:hypothetical protein
MLETTVQYFCSTFPNFGTNNGTIFLFPKGIQHCIYLICMIVSRTYNGNFIVSVLLLKFNNVITLSGKCKGCQPTKDAP